MPNCVNKFTDKFASCETVNIFVSLIHNKPTPTAMHLTATSDTAAPLHINYSLAPKPVINLSELAEVLAAVPEVVRQRTPLDILKGHYYQMAFKKPALIEEVEAVIQHEETRRARPLMSVAR